VPILIRIRTDLAIAPTDG